METVCVSMAWYKHLKSSGKLFTELCYLIGVANRQWKGEVKNDGIAYLLDIGFSLLSGYLGRES